MDKTYAYNYQVTKDKLHELNRHKSPVIWLTGLSASGKSSIANALQYKLASMKIFTRVLDGDNFRLGLNKDLGFSMEDRKKNIERVAEVSKLFSESGAITITAFISPTREIREMAKQIIGEEDFFEIFINTPLEICELRDPKGLYKKARAGELKDFTGIDSIYEKPENSHLTLNAHQNNIEECTDILINFLKEKEIIKLVKTHEDKWFGRNHGGEILQRKENQHAVFVGRYQPYHLGHINLVKQKLKLGVPVLIMVRDIEPDQNNPFTTEQTIFMIRKYHESQGDNVKVMAIPDIESINWGRGVGYEMNEYFPPNNIHHISATKIRDSIKNGDNDWRELIDETIQKEVMEYLTNQSSELPLPSK